MAKEFADKVSELMAKLDTETQVDVFMMIAETVFGPSGGQAKSKFIGRLVMAAQLSYSLQNFLRTKGTTYNDYFSSAEREVLALCATELAERLGAADAIREDTLVSAENLKELLK